MRRVQWWILGVGLGVSATVLTAGFAWSISNATHRHAEEALSAAGIDGVAVTNSYRDVTLTGPIALRDAAVGAVGCAPLVEDVTYVVSPGPVPEPEPSPSPSIAVSPSPSVTGSPTPSPEPSVVIADLASVIPAPASFGFATDTADLDAASRAALDEVAVKMLAALVIEPTVRLSIVGHTDSISSAAYNQRLSEARAAAVADYLISRGVPSAALVVSGAGETQPVANNSTESGRAANRRVDIIILEV